jgi:hypothetical protein
VAAVLWGVAANARYEWGVPSVSSIKVESKPSTIVKIDMAGEQQQPGRDEFLSSADGVREPPTGHSSGDLDANIVAFLRGLAEMINQRPESGPFRG